MASTPNDAAASPAGRKNRSSTDILFPEPSDVPRDSSFTAFDTVLAQATRQSYISVSTSHRNSSYEAQQHQTQQSQHLQQQQHFPGRANSVSSFSQPSATPPRIGSTSQSSSPYASSQVSSQVSVELRRNSSSVSDAGRAHIPSYQEAMARRAGDEMVYRGRGSTTDSNGSRSGSYLDITQSNSNKNPAAKPPAAPTAVTGPSPSKYGRPSPSSSSARSSQYHSSSASTVRAVAPHHPPLPPTSASYRSNTDSQQQQQQQQPNVGRASRTPPPQAPPPPIPHHGSSSGSAADETSSSSSRKGQPPMRFPPPPPYPPPPLSECDRPPPSTLVSKRRPSDSSSIYSITSNGSSVSTRCGVQQPAPNPRGPPVNMATSLQKAGLIRPVAYKPVASSLPMSPYGITVNGRPPSCQSAPPSDYLTSDGRQDGVTIPADSVVVYTDTEDFEQERLQRSLSEDPAPRSSSSQSHRGSKAKNRHLNMEEALKEKDREIQNLRDTMEKNEKVIVDVYNDKQRWWREEMNTITKDHKEKMKVQDTRSVKMDEMLGTQIGGLKDDIKKLKDNKEQLNDEIGLVEKRLSDLKQHLGEVKSALSETGWEVKQKNGEISMLKNQLKEVSNTGREAQNQVMGLRVQLKDTNQDIEDKENKIANTKNEMDSAQTKIDQLKEESKELDEQEKSEELRARKVASDTVSINEEMRKLREMFDANESMMADQRKGWIEEKERLILFQKQLQLNYIQMTQRTNSLDAEMHQLLTSLRELGHEVEVDWSHDGVNGNVSNGLGSTASTPTSGSGGASGSRGIQLMPLPFEDIWGSSNGVNVDTENRNNASGDNPNAQSTIC